MDEFTSDEEESGYETERGFDVYVEANNVAPNAVAPAGSLAGDVFDSVALPVTSYQTEIIGLTGDDED